MAYQFFLNPNWNSVPKLTEGIPKATKPNSSDIQLKGTYSQYFKTKVDKVIPGYINDENEQK
ncbi:hypothetical protein DICPUDRAFT_153276 [Dictyostelium purpureum]|uniref:Uncharacterized protein n=1 Tax=Dictyostelium purpureum TaxID=5786 RepID=F0ZNH4_DICPU|nr:uncharacterized protein DICPUDRAFT_153276 [Dictyostelium purpureum]EGC34532.1 hypothetical protein DICPUDRAFT_153276 [Dictyostelium purpureum]|eukprot:XP_003288968.1 hypothetical protein DICPUDRAFT_153276 [Dictyostelium purpureum]